MTPLADYIFIEKKPIKNETESGIILAVESMEAEGAAQGSIYAVGPDVKGLKVGSEVVFNEHQYDLLFKNKDEGTDVLVGKKTGIYAIND